MRQLLFKGRLIWLWLNAGQLRVARRLRGNDAPPVARRPPNATLGKKLLKRRFVFAGCDIEMAGRIAWYVESANASWHRQLYSFAWLEDIAFTGHTKEAASFAREFINNFIVEKEETSPDADSPDVTGLRLAEWLHFRTFVLKNGSRRFQRRFVRAVVAHLWQLSGQLHQAEPKEAFYVIKGLLAASVYLPMLRINRRELCARLEKLLEDVVLADGVEATRNPEEHLHTLRHLIEMRDMLLMVGEENLEIERQMTAMGTSLRFFCHGDGRLALFNGALMEDAALIAHVISRTDNGEPVPAHMDASGFFRLERGQTTLLLCGQPQRPSSGVAPSQGSFELSDGSERFVVNCGSYRGMSVSWHTASLSSSAHSTLSLEMLPESDATIEHFPAFDEVAQQDIMSDRFQNDGSQLVARTMRYEQAGDAYGIHERECRVNTGGQQCSGTDLFRLQHVPADRRLRLSLRFHLHPDIRCQRQKDGTISLSSVGGSVWYFTSTMPKHTHIDESVYLGYYGKPQKTLQMVISLDVISPITEFRWSFTRQNEVI